MNDGVKLEVRAEHFQVKGLIAPQFFSNEVTFSLSALD